MAKYSTILPLVLFLVSLFSLFPFLSFSYQKTSIKQSGFKTSLIHRDSPRSPFYKPNATQAQRVAAAVRRSLSRQRRFRKSFTTNGGAVEVRLHENIGEYHMQFYIGTPRVSAYGIADTASDIIWIQCQPCVKCFDQDIPIFQPSSSTSYNLFKCNDDLCDIVPGKTCTNIRDDEPCTYRVAYADSSFSEGVFSEEQFVLTDNLNVNISLIGINFGCGHNNSDPVSEGAGDTAPGVIGLNNETFSLVRQLEVDQFSYCFEPERTKIDSTIRFGTSALMEGDSTPILDQGEKAYYYLNLEGISVDEERLSIPAGTFSVNADGSGGFIIDTGTTFTILNKAAHKILVDGVKRNTILKAVDDTTKNFELCYDTNFDVIVSDAADITFHFTGVDVTLNKVGVWIDNGSGLWCMAILPAGGAMSIWGNYQQASLNVGFKLGERKLYFQYKDCQQ